MPWVKKAAEQYRKQKKTIVMLLPSDTSTAWFYEALKTSDEVRYQTLYTILCKCLFSVVTVQAVTELDNKAAHRHTPVPQRHCPFL